MTTTTPQTAGCEMALVVGGGPEVLAAVEPMLAGRAYQVEFVDMDDEPYGTVLAMKPNLVIVNLGLETPEGFSLLSMLRLDPRTAAIPVLSFVSDLGADEPAPIEIEEREALRLPLTLVARH